MIKSTIKLDGEKELFKKFKKLPDKVQKKVIKPAERAAMKPVVKSARTKVPKDTGTLKKSLGHKQKTYRRTGTIVTVVGAREGFKDPETGHDPSNIAHLVELGHRIAQGGSLDRIGKSHNKKNKGIHTGDVPPHPFLRPAWDSQKSNVLNIMIQRTRAGIEREARK